MIYSKSPRWSVGNNKTYWQSFEYMFVFSKGQPRQYPDIIALPPTKSKNTDVILNENKGMFSKSSVEKDTAKILKYKTDKKPQRALAETLLVAQVIDKNYKIRNIIIGVAFGIKSNTQITWKPDDVDFIFRITDRNKWAIGIFNQTLRDLIPTIEGQTDFPKVYKLILFTDDIYCPPKNTYLNVNMVCPSSWSSAKTDIWYLPEGRSILSLE